MPPVNWFADGQHILTLAGGAIVIGFQALNLMRSYRNAANIEGVRHLVIDNGSEAIEKLQQAQDSIGAVRSMLDRRAPGKADIVWQTGGRRQSDPPPPPPGK